MWCLCEMVKSRVFQDCEKKAASAGGTSGAEEQTGGGVKWKNLIAERPLMARAPAATTSPMSPSGIPESRPPNRVTIPRWMAVILALLAWLIAIPLAHGVVPWAISTLMPRYGWVEGSPGIWNRLGLIPVAVAAALLIWILVLGVVLGVDQTPERVNLGLTPSFLMMRCP